MLCVFADCRLEVRLFYHGEMVHSTVCASPDGCFILQGCAPLGNERIYGPCQAKKVFFPAPDIVSLSPGITKAMSRLLPHLEKGVLVWVAPDGVFIKRFCQGRVYWDGPLAEHREKPNKLERERTCKLLDMNVFSQGAEVQGRLCFIAKFFWVIFPWPLTILAACVLCRVTKSLAGHGARAAICGGPVLWRGVP